MGSHDQSPRITSFQYSLAVVQRRYSDYIQSRPASYVKVHPSIPPPSVVFIRDDGAPPLPPPRTKSLPPAPLKRTTIIIRVQSTDSQRKYLKAIRADPLPAPQEWHVGSAMHLSECHQKTRIMISMIRLTMRLFKSTFRHLDINDCLRPHC